MYSKEVKEYLQGQLKSHLFASGAKNQSEGRGGSQSLCQQLPGPGG
jgi:hypothetical protein